MAPMRASNGRDPGRVPRSGKPVMDRRADAAPLDRRIAGTVVAGDQQNYTLSRVNRPLERPVDRLPGGIEVHAVEIDDPVRLNGARAKLPVPAAIEGGSGARRRRGGRTGAPQRPDRERHQSSILLFCRGLLFDLITGQRPNRCRDPCPQLRLVRAERSQPSMRPWGGGSAPRPMPTCLPPPRLPRVLLPRKCRSGWGP